MKKLNPRTVPLMQYILFDILVVMTPFVVVTKYLQGAVYDFSHMKFELIGFEIPYVVAIAVSLVAIFLGYHAKKITVKKTLAVLVIIGMFAWAQYIQDLYMNMAAYDLQENWHYVTYAAYIFMFFRAFRIRGMTIPHVIIYSFFTAIALSLFDEFFQLFASDRIFDISDTAKDSWGSAMGLILLFFVTETYGKIDPKRHKIRQKRLIDYTRQPMSALFAVCLFSLVMVMISPLLSGHAYWLVLTLLILVVFTVIFLLVHLSQYRRFRIATIATICSILILLTGLYGINSDKNFMYTSPGLTVIRGIPIPYFDFLIYPNGAIRLTDKKQHFNAMDKRFMMKQKPSILLISSGTDGEGGNGFGKEQGEPSFFINIFTSKGTQVLIQKNSEIIHTFNRLKQEGKNILLIYHNSFKID